MSQVDVIEEAKRVLRVEARSILDLVERVDESFLKAVEILYHCKGRIVLMGMGKSGLVGRKIASTFASTGLHPFLSSRRGSEWRFWHACKRGCGHRYFQ